MDVLVISLSIALVAVAGFSATVAVRSRRALRGLWQEHENLKRAFFRFKNDCFRVNRDIFSQLGKLVHAGTAAIPFNAQHGEDFFLMSFFNWKPDGFFVEVGAFDGKVFSNTSAFEAVGWTGILIEANPVQAEKCRTNRPGSTVVHAAVGGPDAEGEITFHQVEGHGAEVLSFLDCQEEHEARCRRAGGAITRVTVPYRSLNAIFREQGLDREIDFMTVDVEGKEFDVIRGLDWKRYSPKVVLMENNSGVEQDEIGAFMENLGYGLSLRIECNDVYVRQDR